MLLTHAQEWVRGLLHLNFQKQITEMSRAEVIHLSVVYRLENGSLATGDHMVQNPPYCRAITYHIQFHGGLQFP